jgi:hypothetical protein
VGHGGHVVTRFKSVPLDFMHALTFYAHKNRIINFKLKHDHNDPQRLAALVFKPFSVGHPSQKHDPTNDPP